MNNEKVNKARDAAVELSMNEGVSNAVGAIIGLFAIFILAVLFISFMNENFMQSYIAKVDAYPDSTFEYVYQQEGILLLALVFALITGSLCGARIAAEKKNNTIAMVIFAVFAIGTIVTLMAFWLDYVFSAVLLVALLCFLAVGTIGWVFFALKEKPMLMTVTLALAALVLLAVGLLYAAFLFNFPPDVPPPP